MTERIGFIGLGYMGHGMAKNLVEKGHPLTVMGHRNRVPVDDLVKRGAKEAKSAADVAKNSDIVFLCVTGSPEVEALVRGADGLKAGAQQGPRHRRLLDLRSQFDHGARRRIESRRHRLLRRAARRHAGAGGGRQALGRWSAATRMCGRGSSPSSANGPRKPCASARTGDGHKMKLLMNFLRDGLRRDLFGGARGRQESGALAAAVDSGLRGSRMDCGFYQTFFSYVLDRNREAHKFTLNNAHKDMNYLAAMAESAGVANPVGGAVKNYYAMAVAAGRGEDFVPMLSDFVAGLNGVSLADDEEAGGGIAVLGGPPSGLPPAGERRKGRPPLHAAIRANL